MTATSKQAMQPTARRAYYVASLNENTFIAIQAR